MLTADLVQARRRGSVLYVTPLKKERLQRALEIAEHYLRAVQDSIGRPREEMIERCKSLPLEARDRRLAAGLRKLIEDRCQFESAPEIDPIELRRVLFTRAAQARNQAESSHAFDREPIIADVAREYQTSVETVERCLFADLRTAHRLLAIQPLTSQALVELYDQAQIQAVLLRAVKVTVFLKSCSPQSLRRFFQRLKFHRLLFLAQRSDEQTIRVVIDGPFSLFRQVNKYGLQLALLLPALAECEKWDLEAEVLWGKNKKPLVYHISSQHYLKTNDKSTVELPQEIETLRTKINSGGPEWRATKCSELFHLPGVGFCIPDLVLEKGQSDGRVYFELLGYWSREAVWRRVALVEKGLPERFLFAASSHLRVSEKALDGLLPGALYVYKHILDEKIVLKKADELLER